MGGVAWCGVRVCLCCVLFRSFVRAPFPPSPRLAPCVPDGAGHWGRGVPLGPGAALSFFPSPLTPRAASCRVANNMRAAIVLLALIAAAAAWPSWNDVKSLFTSAEHKAAAVIQSAEQKAIHALTTSVTGMVAGKICGSYCGQHWCAGDNQAEGSCVSDGDWSRTPTDNSCVDNCCKAHDLCCAQGGSGKAQCNRKIVECTSHCSDFGKQGTCAFAVHTALSLVEGWCCGSKCT